MSANLTLRKLADRTGVPELITGDDGKTHKRWPLAGVKLIGEAPAVHGFRYSYLEDAEAEGWADVSMRQVVLHLVDGDVTYRVTGRWASGNGVDVELYDEPED